MKRKDIEQFFAAQYDAVAADDARCRGFLDETQRLIVGFLFSDPVQNYHFLSEYDLQAFPDAAAADIRLRQHSPFTEMLLIFYEDGEGVSCKLVNGMAGKLLLEAQRFCSN